MKTLSSFLRQSSFRPRLLPRPPVRWLDRGRRVLRLLRWLLLLLNNRHLAREGSKLQHLHGLVEEVGRLADVHHHGSLAVAHQEALEHPRELGLAEGDQLVLLGLGLGLVEADGLDAAPEDEEARVNVASLTLPQT